MQSIKESIPNETALEKKLRDEWGSFDVEIVETVGSLEAEYKEVKRRQKIGGVCIVILVGMIGLIDSLSESDFGLADMVGDIAAVILTILLFPILIGLGIAAYKLLRDKNNVVARFNHGINALLFPKVLSVFGLSGSYISNLDLSNVEEAKDLLWKKINQVDSEGKEDAKVLPLLNHSELVTEPRNRVTVDDMIHVKWEGERTLFIAELDLKHVTGSGKNRRTKHIFSGYFVSFDLARPLTGKTFISTEGDKSGFGHKSFWSGITGDGIEETELEWNDFEKLLHVASDNPIEARYILTTNFMEDLYEWWRLKNRNIRISFIGSRMYMLFPDQGIRFNRTVPSLGTRKMQKYALTIAKPLMHVLHLIEDVRHDTIAK